MPWVLFGNLLVVMLTCFRLWSLVPGYYDQIIIQTFILMGCTWLLRSNNHSNIHSDGLYQVQVLRSNKHSNIYSGGLNQVELTRYQVLSNKHSNILMACTRWMPSFFADQPFSSISLTRVYLATALWCVAS